MLLIVEVKNPHSCTVLIQGSTDHAIAQMKALCILMAVDTELPFMMPMCLIDMKDAIKDGLRATQNCVEDEEGWDHAASLPHTQLKTLRQHALEAIVPGAGAFEAAAASQSRNA